MKNTIKEIDSAEGKIKLTLLRIWGDDDVDDENQFFRFPADIKIAKNGLIYIADSGNNRIQVFDRSANYKRTIGRIGQGPGDLLRPGSIAYDNNNNIVVADCDNYRIHAFTCKGNYLYSFKTMDGSPTYIAVTRGNNIVINSYQKAFKSGCLISLYNPKGKIIKEIGKAKVSNKTYLANFESIYFTIDNEDNFFISFYATPYFQKYSPNGESLLTVTFEMPFKVPNVSLNDKKNDIIVIGEKKHKVSSGISVDNMGRIYLVVTMRPRNTKENFFIVSDGPGTIRRYPKKITSENTDMFRLLVFDPTGKVIASQRLTVFCDNIYVHDKHLFIIDTCMGMKIYEYKISFN